MAISRPRWRHSSGWAWRHRSPRHRWQRLQAALDAESRHHLLALQPVLMALSQTFIDDGDFLGAGIEATPPEVAALMLSQAVGAGLNWPETDPDEPRIGGHPEHIAVDFVCNQTLYGDDDLVGVLDRTLRLWRDYGCVGAPKLSGREPSELLRPSPASRSRTSWHWGSPSTCSGCSGARHAMASRRHLRVRIAWTRPRKPPSWPSWPARPSR